MFNFLGNHKIGIIGDANCGKTVFLTSLLWNLKAAQLRLGKKHLIPTNIKIQTLPKVPLANRFDYEGNVRSFKDSEEWPAKTLAEYSLASCSYKLAGHLKYDITFVDIPGDRMADMLIWQNSSYDNWSAETLKTWQESNNLSQFFKKYNDLLLGDATFDQLTWEFKCGMRMMRDNYIPQISPSTLFFADGKKLKRKDLSDDKWLKERPIWKDGDFIPLPIEWKSASESQKRIYMKCKENYKLYRKKIISPLFSQISSCDNFIYCIDVLGILAQCPDAFHQAQKEIESFMNKILPGFFSNLFNKIGRNPMRIAFVATKSDKVYDMNVTHLENLLKDIVCPYRKKEVDDKYFTCTAWNSTKKTMVNDKIYASGNAFYPDGSINNAIIEVPELPDTFENNWNGEDYQYLETLLIPSHVDAKPPKQTGIDSIMNYVIDDIY